MKLVAQNLVIARGTRTIVSNLSFCVEAGQALVFTGPNGSGKTTLLRTLAGFLHPLSGRLALEGGESEKSVAEQCHFVGHASAVKGSLSVEENTDFWSRFLCERGETAAVSSRALAQFGLSDLAEFPVAYLSAGQRRRTGLARLLAAHRPLWLLDEPAVSLDTVSVARLAEAVNAHLGRSGLVIAATHQPLGLRNYREMDISTAQAVA